MAAGPSINFPCIRGTFCELSVHLPDLPSTFRAKTGPTLNFRKLSVRPNDHPLTFRESTGPSVNFSCVHRNFRHLLPTSLASEGPFVHFLSVCRTFGQHSMRPRDLPTTSRNFQCSILSTFLRPHDLLTTSVNFLYIHVTFHLFPTTFCASEGSSVNVSCGCGTLHQLASNFRTAAGLSVNFLFILDTFRQLPSTFCAIARLSINFHLLYRRPPVLSSTFRPIVGPSANFLQLSVRAWDLVSTAVNLPCIRRTFC